MTDKHIHERIAANPANAHSPPVIRNTQVPVHQVLDRAAAGKSPEQIVAELPELELADVKAALAYAAGLVRRQAPKQLSSATREGDLRPSLAAGDSDQSTALDLNRILVVDDQEINRLYMQSMFRGSEFTLSLAADGKEALVKARAELPFLVLADVQMPHMDGFEFCRQLKADEQTKSVAVIFITAHHRSSRKVIEGLDLGADDYIFRPFERGELLSRVKAVARLKRAEAEARRQAQTVARRNKELELLNELALAVASSLDLDDIFAFSIQKISQLLDAEAISLLCLEAETQQITVNLTTRAGKRVSDSVDFRPETSVADGVMQEEVPSVVSKILADSNVDLGSPSEPLAITSIPMISKEQIIGALAVVNTPGGSLSDTDRVLLNSAAGIVAVAIENARLLQSVQQQVVDLILLNEIGHALTSTLDLEQILHRTTRMVQESLRADAASLWLVDEDGQGLGLTASYGPSAQPLPGFRLPIDSGIPGHVIQTGEPYFFGDELGDKKYDDCFPGISDAPPGSMLCVPVRVKDIIIGLLMVLHEHACWFDQNDLRLLYSVASSVGIAIENAWLFTEVQEFNRQLEQMVAERTRELAEEKEKTEAILASMADGLLVLDADNCVLTANTVAEEMLNFRLSEAQGQPIGTESLSSPVWLCVGDMVTGDEFVASSLVDVPDPTKLGGVLSLQALAARIRVESEKVIGTVIVLRDITTITEVERMKARFMTGVTHELKTPLSVIRLHATNLQAYHTRLPDRKRGELLNGIQTQVNLLDQLVEDILELSRLDAGDFKGDRVPVDLAELADEMMEDLLPLATGKGIAFRYKQPAASVTVLSDKGQMKRVIRNLIENAIKYTPPGGSVSLQLVSDSENNVVIRVTDTGIGIPLEHQARVFDRFYRVDPSHTIPGTGLGLSIVEEIVAAHGGNVRLESKPGAGSTFTVTMPGMEQFEKDEPSG